MEVSSYVQQEKGSIERGPKKRKTCKVSFDEKYLESSTRRACEVCKKFTDSICVGFDAKVGLSEDDQLLLPTQKDQICKLKHSACPSCLGSSNRCSDCERQYSVCMQEIEKNKKIMEEALSIGGASDQEKEEDSSGISGSESQDETEDDFDEEDLTFGPDDFENIDIE